MPRKPPPISMFGQLMAAAAQSAMQPEAPRSWPHNPFPAGVRSGSVTDKVLAAAVAAHPGWLEHSELMRLTGGSRGAIAWAVRYLQAKGRLRSVASARHPQYRRYQAVVNEPVE